MDRITMPSALLSCLLLIPLRGHEPCQKQVVIGHRGRSPRNMRVLRIFFFAVVFLLVASIFIPSYNDGVGPARKAKAKNAVDMLIIAAKAYKEEYGEPPKGDSRSVLHTLQSDNPRKIVFLEISPKELSKDGIYLDPWGTPYVYDLSISSPWAYSFGKNKRDEGGNGDDAASWQ